MNYKINYFLSCLVIVLLVGCTQADGPKTFNSYPGTKFSNLSEKEGKSLGEIVKIHLRFIKARKYKQALNETMSRKFIERSTLKQFKEEIKQRSVESYESYRFKEICACSAVGPYHNDIAKVEFIKNGKKTNQVVFILIKENGEWKINGSSPPLSLF